MKSMVENRGRWDAGFRSPLLRFSFLWGVPIAAMAQPGLAGREGDSLGEWWVGAVGWRVGLGSLESCCAGTKSTP